MAKIITIITILLALCISAPSNAQEAEKDSTGFATSLGIVKDGTYVVGPLWIIAERSIKDPTMWEIKVANPYPEDIYNAVVVMIFYQNSKQAKVTQNVLRIYEGPMGAGDLSTVHLRVTYKHTHIGFSALIEK
jgi:hypothetical protein